MDKDSPESEPFIQMPDPAPAPESPVAEPPGYGIDHLSAVVRPVALTMICASLAVAWVRDPVQDAAISSGLNMYLVYNNQTSSSSSSEASTGQQLGQAVINAIVIVCAVAAATFVLVACYYFRLLKCMLAYLIFASVNLLGYTGAFMVISAVTAYKAIFDYGTLAFLMFNFAAGGVVAVFWQKGIPRLVTQGYLVAVSVIMAWILTKLPEWTSWALLVALALYDLCAVLTPCGPLKALVKLAQERQDPIPGLLYEANVGPERRGGNGVRDTFSSGAGGASAAGRPPNAGLAGGAQTPPIPPQSEGQPPQARAATALPSPASAAPGDLDVEDDAVLSTLPPRRDGSSSPRAVAAPSSLPPLAIPLRSARSRPAPVMSAPAVAAATEDAGHPSGPPLSPAAALLRGIPAGYAPVPPANNPPPPLQLQPAAPPPAPPDDSGSDQEEERSIKLGLGDFVFYSVLVSRAALFDMTTFMACLVSVLVGLGGTLLLLGLYKKALPALPISIFLGVSMYFLCALVITPMIVELTLSGVAI